ncbi:hypothetical protein DM860_008624 [Cuscuta australis]|uniref:Uncharacterized protein n=1 Tax=Cuscuta australis TaxID=267555 RepID=A0A328D5U8_9ASTE|nr:hypothetical protein DM860_008624 [Cuscuta australis]
MKQMKRGKQWAFPEISMCAPLKSISTKAAAEGGDCRRSDDERSTTPTARGSRIPERLPCPPAPRKRRPSSVCRYNGVKEFFDPPELESVFVRRVERAN